MAPSLTSCPRQSKGVSFSSLDNEVLIIDTAKRRSHRLLETASFVWNRCDGKHSIASIIGDLTSTYDVASDDAERDVLELLSSFQAEGVIEHSQG